jgi:hypothetical protein
MADIDSLSKEVLAILDALPNQDSYDSQVPDTPAQGYTVFYPGAGTSFGDRLSDLKSKLEWDFRVVCAGRSPGQARRVVKQTRAGLTGVRIDEGRVLIVEDRRLNAPMLRDDAVPAEVRFSQTLRFKASATRS